ncbi:MAG: RHS repeat protein [Nitrospirae bacterium]|nr:RHS repeat protein [Nitrospirota bacterium]
MITRAAICMLFVVSALLATQRYAHAGCIQMKPVVSTATHDICVGGVITRVTTVTGTGQIADTSNCPPPSEPSGPSGPGGGDSPWYGGGGGPTQSGGGGGGGGGGGSPTPIGEKKCTSPACGGGGGNGGNGGGDQPSPGDTGGGGGGGGGEGPPPNSGDQKPPKKCTGSSVIYVDGTYTFSATDLRVPAVSIGMSLERTYRSNRIVYESGWKFGLPVDGPLGYGWTSPYFAKVAGDTFIDGEGKHYRFKTGSDGNFLTDARSGFTLIKKTSGYELKSTKGWTAVFDATGALVSIKDRLGSSASMQYENGRLVSVTDVTGRVALTFTYNAEGRIETATDPDGRVVRYGYDALGNLVMVTDVAGRTTAYAYDARHCITTKTDPASGSYTMTYSAAYGDIGAVETIMDPAGNKTSFQYDFSNRVYFQTDYSGAKYRMTVNADGDVTSEELVGSAGNVPLKKAEYLPGGILKTTDAAGNVTTDRRDEWGNRLSRVDGEGNETKYTYAGNRLLTRTNALGVTDRCEYDSNEMLTREVFASGTPDETVTAYTYDSYGRILTATRAGATTRYAYNQQGQKTSVTDPLGSVTRMEYDGYGDMTAIVDSLGNRTEFTYSADGEMLTRKDPLGNVTTNEYDEGGRLSSTTDPLGNVTMNEYDVMGRVVRTINPLHIGSAMEYDAKGNMVKSTELGLLDADGNDLDPADNVVTLMAYDSAGRRTFVTDPEGNVTAYEYNDAGCGCPNGGSSSTPAQITDPLGNVTVNTFDKDGRVIAVTVNATVARSVKYDAAGRVAESTDAHGGMTAYTYDSLGRVKTVTDPMGHTSRVTYNSVGQVYLRTDANGNATSNEYDVMGRVTRQTDALGGVTEFTYNATGTLASLKDAEGNTTAFAYDSYGRKVKETRPMGEYAVFAYDTYGRLATKTDAKGQVTTYSYDGFSRPTGVQYADGKAETFGYDAKGRLATYAGDVSGSLAYDKYGRKLTEMVDFGAFAKSYSYAYDALGRKESYTAPDGAAYNYTYTTLGQLAGITQGTSVLAGYTYDFDQLSGRTVPGVLTSYSYNANGWLAGIDAGSVMDYSYGFDNVGNITSKATEHGTYAYAYDKLYRLTGSDNPALADESFGYDKVGNRTASADAADWSYNQNNALVGYNGVSYAYDANGSTVSKSVSGQATNFAYSAKDRLEQVNLPDGRVATYKYDPFGRRISKTVDGVVTYFMYADEGLAAEMDSAGVVTKTYGWRPDGTWGTAPVFMVTGGAAYYYHNDHLGTPRKMTDGSGSVVWSAEYTVFGKAVVASESTVTNNLWFPGQYFDEETGLHYNFHRYYDPETGRYVEADPIGLRGGRNLYTYGSGDPMNMVDYDGMAYRRPTSSEYTNDCRTYEHNHQGPNPYLNPGDYYMYPPWDAQYKLPDPGKSKKAHLPSPPPNSTTGGCHTGACKDDKNHSDVELPDAIYFGGEAHALVGAGVEVFVYCENGKLKAAAYIKLCLGAALGYGYGGGGVWGYEGSDFAGAMSGPSIEAGVGPIEGGASLSPSLPTSAGVSVGEGGKFTPCWYFLLKVKELGCCPIK